LHNIILKNRLPFSVASNEKAERLKARNSIYPKNCLLHIYTPVVIYRMSILFLNIWYGKNNVNKDSSKLLQRKSGGIALEFPSSVSQSEPIPSLFPPARALLSLPSTRSEFTQSQVKFTTI
jgi:hypothetical protein